MPIIVPPTRNKAFGEHGKLFSALWSEARAKLADAARLIICGYSFPETDEHAYELIDAFLSRDASLKQITLIDPYPTQIAARLKPRISGQCKVDIHQETLHDYLGLSKRKTTGRASKKSEYSKCLSSSLRTKHEKNPRVRGLFNILVTCNLSGQPIDITTYSGRRLLNCEVAGEFATHLRSAYRPEVYEYRVQNIKVRPRGEPETTVALDDIWLLNPMPKEGISEDALKNADLKDADEFNPLLGTSLRDSIRRGYHCKDEAETDYFLRRFIAS